MKLQDQVPSLELCKELKKLNYPQNRGLFRYVFLDDTKFQLFYIPDGVSLVAPTVAEMGEWFEKLPRQDWEKEAHTKHDYTGDEWTATVLHDEKAIYIEYFNKEADARANILIYLAKNKIIKFNEA